MTQMDTFLRVAVLQFSPTQTAGSSSVLSLIKHRGSDTWPLSKLTLNGPGSFYFLHLGMLTVGIVLLGSQPPGSEAIQEAACRHHKEKTKVHSRLS